MADPAPCTEDAKREGELNAARRLVEQCELDHALVTRDALHGERQTVANLPAAGADFLFQLKDNQPKAIAQARKIAATQPPLFPATPSRPTTAGSTSAG